MDIQDHMESGKSGFEGKVAIVTGAGAPEDGIGNGRAAAICLARAGARVVAMDYLQDRAERTVEMITNEGGEAVALSGDASQADTCAGMVKLAMERYGRLDILDNNVGMGSFGSVVDESEENWNTVMRTNVNSMFLASKHAIPAMIESGEGGAIVNVGSISALRPRGLTAYSTSKGAVIALTRAMAVDHAREGIRVNCVLPGPVYTPMVYALGMTEDLREKRRKASPLDIEGTGWDIGHAVAFLASPRARFITGQMLVVDGGVTLASPGR
jgi:NAD(P)-dependent dehydrogenase (short-subunit alcohol dehydrogenase family)